MNARDDWPLPADVPAWWADQPLTAEQLDAMAEEYALEQMATAQSEQDAAAWAAHYKENK